MYYLLITDDPAGIAPPKIEGGFLDDSIDAPKGAETFRNERSFLRAQKNALKAADDGVEESISSVDEEGRKEREQRRKRAPWMHPDVVRGLVLALSDADVARVSALDEAAGAALALARDHPSDAGDTEKQAQQEAQKQQAERQRRNR